MYTRLALLPLALLSPLVMGLGCTDLYEEPDEGLLWVVEAEDGGALSYDAYEVQLVWEGGTGYSEVTLESSDDYQVTWAQSLVDDKAGGVAQMTAYESRDPMGPDYDKPLSETRELVFEDGQTSEGRLVLVYVSE
ncbi:MAG: hypothetical protein VX899_16145 [Myxococcota bacterium]|nr:hypothetical protein [Myxococcota bacterium]